MGRSEELPAGRIDHRDHLFVGTAHQLPTVPQLSGCQAGQRHGVLHADAPLPQCLPQVRGGNGGGPTRERRAISWAIAWCKWLFGTKPRRPSHPIVARNSAPVGPCSDTQRPDARC
jgi:hypothetical protein